MKRIYGLSISTLTIFILLIISLFGIRVAAATSDQALKGYIESVRIDKTLGQIIIEGWAIDKISEQGPEQLHIKIGESLYKINSQPLLPRKDVQIALNTSTLETGFSKIINLKDQPSDNPIPLEITALFPSGTSLKLSIPNNNISTTHPSSPREKRRHWILLALIILTVTLAYSKKSKKWIDAIDNWIQRHPLKTSSLIFSVFILLVCTGITGSSLALLKNGPQGPFGNGFLEFRGSNTTLLKPRENRSDEWGVLTANILAQWNHHPRFPITNTNIGLEGQNMGVIGMTGVPIMQLSAVARPATWGYFFLPLRQALSWQWYLPFFACLFLLWKMLNSFTPEKSGFNLTLAALFCTAPYAAAWSHWPLYATLFPLALFIIVTASIKTPHPQKKIITGLSIGAIAAGWIFVLYPPWQITIGTFIAVFSIGWLIDHRSQVHHKRNHWLIFLIAIATFSLFIMSWWTDTADAIAKIKETIYPGARKALSGGEIPSIWALRGYTNPEALLAGTGPLTNQSEISSYIFFPIPIIILSVISIIHSTKNRWTLCACLLFLAWWTIFRFFGVPPWLAELSLWSRVPSGRVDLVMGLVFTILMALYQTQHTDKKQNEAKVQWLATLFISIASAYIVYIGIKLQSKELFPQTSNIFLFAMVFSAFFASWWMMRGKMRAAVTMILILNLFSTLGFNPVSRAPESVGLSEAAADLASDKHPEVLRTLLIGGWGVGPLSLAAAGIPTVNGVLYYPQRLFWDRLGLASEDWPTVNRYQHLGVELGFLPADSSTFQVKSNQIDSVDLILDPLRFDFTTTGAYRVVALEKDAKLLRLSPYLKEQGQYNGLFWFSVQNK